MSRYHLLKELPRPGFRTPDLLRLAGGVSMLVILYMLIVWAREADTWRWLAGEEPAGPSSPPHQSPDYLPGPTGPTDEDPDELQTAQEEFQVLTDGTLTLLPEEMEPYDRLVRWAKNQAFERLQARARRDLLYTNFYDQPEKHRGSLVMLKFDVRRTLDAGKNRDEIPLHEVWGFSDESRGRPYVLVVVDYPPGMPVGPRLNEKAIFVGYFLKLQGYLPADAPLGALPEKAPLLIGRLKWLPVAAPPQADIPEWLWWTMALVAIVGLLAAHVFYLRTRFQRKSLLPNETSTAEGEVNFIDDWLAQTADSEQPGSTNHEKSLDDN